MNMYRALLLLVFCCLICNSSLLACSGYKVTVGNKTMFCSNEDAWRTTPHIWFEPGNAKTLGAAFTGSRFDGDNGYAPQAGMNTAGLAFERLASYYPLQNKPPQKLPITNPTLFLKQVLHTCKTVEEVQAFYDRYDHSCFIDDVFIYTDKSGKYLIVEPYTAYTGNEPWYVFSNFCPSITPQSKARSLKRYSKGVDLLQLHSDTSLAFCRALADSMHVCRRRKGDGTLLSAVYDLRDGNIHLYFYHAYDSCVSFNLQEELSKGEHILAIDKLFAPNPEFLELADYKTPKNNLYLGMYVICCGGFFFLCALFAGVYYLRKRKTVNNSLFLILFILLNLWLLYFMILLSGSIHIFYMDDPFSTGNIITRLSAYLPILLAILLIPFFYFCYRVWQRQQYSLLFRYILSLNAANAAALICLFVYWGFL